MNKFILVRQDNTVQIDGIITSIDLSDVDPTIQAVYWENGSGFIQYIPSLNIPNDEITSLSQFSYYIDKATIKISEIPVQALQPVNPLEVDPNFPTTTDILKFHSLSGRKTIISSQFLVNVGTRNIPVWIDDGSRASMRGASIVSDANINETITWKSSDGQFYNLTNEELKTMILNVEEFIQSVFSTEKQINDKIDSGTITTIKEVTLEVWPANGFGPYFWQTESATANT